MYERLRGDARELVSALAEKAAEELHHEYVGAEHLFLALAKHRNNAAAQILHELGVLDQTIKQHVDLIQSGPEGMEVLGRRPRTPRAKRVVQFAEEEARNHPISGQRVVCPEHLLLGMFREDETVPGQVLRNSAVTYEAICNRLAVSPLRHEAVKEESIDD